MKLYDNPLSPNARRVRVFLAEKAIELPHEEISLTDGTRFAPEFLAKNPMGQIPVLEFDDGTYLAESVAICRYFEEVQREPPLFGTTARGKADVEMWSRRIELALFQPVLAVWKHTDPMWANRVQQVPAIAESEKARVAHCLSVLDAALNHAEFLAGDRFSIADILALCTLDFAAAAVRLSPAPELHNLARWHADVTSRPSARA
jgi:glutathione S-transferase